ncbi:hypothetical protein ABW19_dt0207131 [Dactylella cylindrospora]|nr:hypothetical protein ABW19_dt0207131 [Dactylella cylindrospora]
MQEGSAWARLMRASPAVVEIGRHLSVTDLIALTRSSHITRAAFYCCYDLRIDLRLKLSRYFKDAEALLNSMRKHCAVIGGSRAVSMIWDGVAGDSSDWNFFVPQHHFSSFVTELRDSQGLTRQAGKTRLQVLWLRNMSFEWCRLVPCNTEDLGGKRVSVMVAMAPRFGSEIPSIIGKCFMTALNCFSCVDATFIGYPEFTLNKTIVVRRDGRYTGDGERHPPEYWQKQKDILTRYVEQGWNIVDAKLINGLRASQPKECTTRRSSVIRKRKPYWNNATPIKILHKQHDSHSQITGADFGNLLKIREEQYRFVNFLPPVWTERTWAKLEPTFKIDPTSMAAKAPGQGMDSFIERSVAAAASKGNEASS